MNTSLTRKTVTFAKTEWELATEPDLTLIDWMVYNIWTPLSDDREFIQRKVLEESCPILIRLYRLKGAEACSVITDLANTDVEYSLRVSLFDSQYNQFFGRTWTGPRVRGQYDGDSLTIPYNQNVYVHTWIKDTTLVLAVEVACHDTAKGQESSCGWTFLRPFAEGNELEDVSAAKPSSQQTDLYHGTVRALLYMEEPLEKCTGLKKAGTGQLLFSVQTHQELEKVVQLIPENVLVGGTDCIPGLAEKKGDSLRKPRPSRCSPCYLENIVIKLPPSLDKFEEELCKQLNTDRLARDDKKADGTVVSVFERRLQVGVHNGWCYVATPQVFHLSTDAVSDKNKRGHRRTSSWDGRPRTDPAASGLVLKNRVELDCLVDDPLYSIVFKLEYVVAEPLSAQQRRSSMVRSTNVTACVRWLAWSPFNQDNRDFSCELVGGATMIPDNVLVFTQPKRMSADQEKMSPGTINFKFVSPKKSGSSLPVPREEEMMEARSVATVAAEAPSLFAPSLPPESPRRPPSRRMEDQPRSPTPQHMMSGRDMMSPYMQTPYIMPYGQMPAGVMYPHDPALVRHGSFNEPISPRTVQDLKEVSYQQQTYQPIIAANMQSYSGQGLSRAAYACLYTVGFPAILDRNGDPPEVRDPDSFSSVDPQKEMYDSLQGNEITLQFLAFTRASSLAGEPASDTPACVFFTFQFYRFPAVTTERLLLSEAEEKLSAGRSGMPAILRKVDKMGQVRTQELPGYEVKYCVDPAFLRGGEARLFPQHLAQQTLHVDVWDGDSLLLLGTAAVDLKYLLRQGEESVQTTFELDVVSSEYADDTATNMTGDMTRSGSVRPVGVQTQLQGRLHFRMANCGFPVEKRYAKDIMSSAVEARPVVEPGQNSATFRGGSLTSSQPVTLNSCRASPLAETNRELASMLGPAERDESRNLDPVKARKLARMNAVRKDTGDTVQPFSWRSLSADQSERTRVLKTIDVYRDQNKKDAIANMLNRCIATEHSIYPSAGTAEFFEFSLKNPYNVPHTVTVIVRDEELSVVRDPAEWRHFKAEYGLASPVEEKMFDASADAEAVKVYLRPKEKVMVPFKFYTLRADHSACPQAPLDDYRRMVDEKKSTLMSRTVPVEFVTEDDRLISVMNVHVALQPHVVNQTFRFNHPEDTFFKKAIRLPPFVHALGRPPDEDARIFVRTTDPNVIAEAKVAVPGEPMDVFIKVACGKSPEVKKFFVLVYNNRFTSRPAQVWQFFIHSLQRVDVNCTEGQITKATLILRGTQASRLVAAHSSSPLELAVQPSEAFMLAANTVHELQISVCSKRVGSKFLYINVVDAEYHQLIRTWLVSVQCSAPVVSKAFQLQLPLAKSSNKRITYTNSYQVRKKFSLHTNRDDLIQFKEHEMDLGPTETYTIGLRFTPCFLKMEADILIFINDSEHKTEETFCVKATYC